MNKVWSEKSKEIQQLLKQEATWKEGIEELLALRREMFQQITRIVNRYPRDAFSQMPFAGAPGYHSKTLAYSVWHIFRIEDITAHELIAEDEQVFFSGQYQEQVHSPIITTGNELEGEAIAVFSEKLDIQSLYGYAKAVMESTDKILLRLEYKDLKRKFGTGEKEKLLRSGCVDPGENAVWLIDYWCSRDVRGLLKMPFCRHWIMHVEAMQRIKNKLCKLARKGVDPVAYCGFSCNHCFLGAWCGSCRTEYNTCSFAECFPDNRCPNVTCCKEKGIDGCYECPDLENCTKGFYTPENDGANAAKAQALFVRKYGKKEFLKVHDRLHAERDFLKTQEVLGQDLREGFEILERYIED